ncbi:MAG: hypothetical protein RIM23_25390 [Coleofasciculus sp. G3-WIS-01]
MARLYKSSAPVIRRLRNPAYLNGAENNGLKQQSFSNYYNYRL